MIFVYRFLEFSKTGELFKTCGVYLLFEVVVEGDCVKFKGKCQICFDKVSECQSYASKYASRGNRYTYIIVISNDFTRYK